MANRFQRGTDKKRKGYECIQLLVLWGKTTLSTAERGPKMIPLGAPRCTGPALPSTNTHLLKNSHFLRPFLCVKRGITEQNILAFYI